MARPRRTAAKQCRSKVKKSLEELQDSPHSNGADMDHDLLLASDSEDDEVGGSSDEEPSLRKGKSRNVDGGDNMFQKQSPPKPRTPQLRSAPAKRARTSAPVIEVVELESDSSDPEFVAVAESSTSDSDSSYEDCGTRRRNSRVRVAAELSEDDEGRGRQRRRRGATAPPMPRRRATGKGRYRGKSKVQDPVKKLGWEISDDEWGDVWGNATDADFHAFRSSKFPLEQREPPAELLMPLLPFQKEWLAWSMKQEESVTKGGILADEMGMGKTIQAISLIVAGRAIGQGSCSSQMDLNVPLEPARAAHGSHTGSSQKQLPQVKATLVVCPLVAVLQWRNEVARFTASGSVKVLVYHGPKRSIGLTELSEYDIILTTYTIVEVEHRKHVMPPKDPCKWCGKLYYPEKMAIHQHYFCGPRAQKTAKQAKQEKKRKGSQQPQTSEAEAKEVDDSSDSDEDVEIVKGKGSVKGKGAKSTRKGNPRKPVGGRGRKRKIVDNDLGDALIEAIAVTEMATEKASSSDASKGNSVLHSVRWQRIILDEAHSIKDRRCSTAKAAFALQSEYKWALSGTPLQNRVGELYSLVRFLGIHPFSYYFCRKCDCKSLDYKFGMNGQKCECGHSPLHHFCWWNKFIANPIKRWGYVQDGRRAMQLLKHKVLSNTLLRRTKLERAADLALPPRTAFLRRDSFDPREEDFYHSLYTKSQSQFDTYIAAGTLVNNYAHIFDLLTRLRQAVDHPYLVLYSATSSKESPPQLESAVPEVVCGLCHEPAEDSVTTGCNHLFCRLCIEEHVAALKDLTSQCPKCDKPLTVDLTGTKASTAGNAQVAREMGYRTSSILNRIDLGQFQTSTKIDAVREEINFMLASDPAAKAIIFSQFTSMLDLIGYSLQMFGIKFVKLDGSMNMAARDRMIETFTHDADTKVFLMSLKAGGVALNLTVASHVFLMDPWWNPAVEQQAQDRIHRIGQFKPIRVTRFVIENTIEERILKLQEKKQLVFEGTVGGSADALGRLTEEDLRFLFTN